MIPKNSIRINPNDGMYCRNCKKHHYGDPERIKLKHTCTKTIKKKKYIFFGKVSYSQVPMSGDPDLIPISEVKK